tara:strand:- start:15577 stop:16140 length:564 start_codon:yes stop_codon:yes gene_type:complete
MNLKKTVFALTLTLLILSCGNSEGNSASNDESSQSEQVTSKDVNFNSPCELVSSKEIKSICNVESKYEIVQADKLYTYPTCTFKWEDKKVSQVTSIGGNEVKYDMPSEVLIVMVSNSTEKMFEQATVVYKDGIDVSVGEKAIWGNKMSQLTFLAKDYMFHVHLKISNDDSDNKLKAIKVAELLIGKI